MQFHFGFDFGCNRLLRKDVGKVTRKLVRVYLLDLTSRKLYKAGEALDVGISASDGDEIDHDTRLLGKLTNFVIELYRRLIPKSIATHSIA